MRDTQPAEVLRYEGDSASVVQDHVVVEEPLEVRVNGQSIGVTMRTPGDDFDLAIGLLRTEGMIRRIEEVGTIAYCADEPEPDLMNIVNITLVERERVVQSSRVNWASSSCGLCGEASLNAIRKNVPPLQCSMTIARDVIGQLPQRMQERQNNFNRTGGIHAAALFDGLGRLLLIREDLGRHNAVDKVLGAAMRVAVSTTNTVLLVSGRLGFEIAQKGLMGGVPVIASVSAPSSLAIALARELGMTAVGFVRNGSMNIYSHPERIIHAL
jgi:FdhD protein